MKKAMKIIVPVCLIVVLAFAFSACSYQGNVDGNNFDGRNLRTNRNLTDGIGARDGFNLRNPIASNRTRDGFGSGGRVVPNEVRDGYGLGGRAFSNEVRDGYGLGGRAFSNEVRDGYGLNNRVMPRTNTAGRLNQSNNLDRNNAVGLSISDLEGRGNNAAGALDFGASQKYSSKSYSANKDYKSSESKVTKKTKTEKPKSAKVSKNAKNAKVSKSTAKVSKTSPNKAGTMQSKSSIKKHAAPNNLNARTQRNLNLRANNPHSFATRNAPMNQQHRAFNTNKQRVANF